MISAKSAGLSTGYVYDGDGQRIQKVACPGGTLVCTASVDQAVITTYVYDASGGLAAEYASQSSASACGTATCYVSVDQIGSTRLLTDNSGAVVRRYDYLPYGEELWAGTGSRTTTMGYQSGSDGFNPKFTGQWRDTESRFDYFNARYYSPEQGRFVSPDPGNAGADSGDPLTWHGYAYVGNNPLNVTDRSGLGWGDFVYSFIHNFLNGGSYGLWDGLTSALDGAAPGPGPVFGLPGLSSAFGCGGVFGNCGSIGGGSWNEQGPGPNVRDPGGLMIQDFGSITGKEVDINLIDIAGRWPDFWYGAPYTPLRQIGKTSLQFRRASFGSCEAAPLDVMEVTSEFGNRERNGKIEFHPGLDLRARSPQPLYAAEGGNVVSAGYYDWGNTITTRSGSVSTSYLHLSQMFVAAGSTVSAGQLIGMTGGTGSRKWISGAHLHFQQKSRDWIPPCGRSK